MLVFVLWIYVVSVLVCIQVPIISVFHKGTSERFKIYTWGCFWFSLVVSFIPIVNIGMFAYFGEIFSDINITPKHWGER